MELAVELGDAATEGRCYGETPNSFGPNPKTLNPKPPNPQTLKLHNPQTLNPYILKHQGCVPLPQGRWGTATTRWGGLTWRG
eukprot:627626-Prorocentrum_minimum.AAC.1